MYSYVVAFHIIVELFVIKREDIPTFSILKTSAISALPLLLKKFLLRTFSILFRQLIFWLLLVSLREVASIFDSIW